MSSQLPALNPAPVDDYEAIEFAVMETARGRAFLLEYARRLRAAETAQVLQALSRLEQRIAAPRTEREESNMHEAVGLVRQRLMAIAQSARAQGVDASTIGEIEAQARALSRLLPDELRPALALSAPMERIEAPAEAPATQPELPPARHGRLPAPSRAAAFAAFDAMDRRARDALFA